METVRICPWDLNLAGRWVQLKIVKSKVLKLRKQILVNLASIQIPTAEDRSSLPIGCSNFPQLLLYYLYSFCLGFDSCYIISKKVILFKVIALSADPFLTELLIVPLISQHQK